MYAIVKTGGKQYKIHEGDIIRVEKIDGNIGNPISFDQVQFFFKKIRGKQGNEYGIPGDNDGRPSGMDDFEPFKKEHIV